MIESGRLAMASAAVFAIAGAAILLMVMLHGCAREANARQATEPPTSTMASGLR